MCSRVAFALVALIAVLAGPASAGDRSAALSLSGYTELLRYPAVQADSGWQAHYAAAMLSYRYFRLATARGGSAYPMLPGPAGLDGMAWVWTAADGSHVQRVRHGLFRLILRDQSASWYRTIECSASAWPNFDCSDGRTRAMSAPTATRIIFGDMAFDRAFLPPATVTELALD